MLRAPRSNVPHKSHYPHKPGLGCLDKPDPRISPQGRIWMLRPLQVPVFPLIPMTLKSQCPPIPGHGSSESNVPTVPPNPNVLPVQNSVVPTPPIPIFPPTQDWDDQSPQSLNPSHPPKVGMFGSPTPQRLHRPQELPHRIWILAPPGPSIPPIQISDAQTPQSQFFSPIPGHGCSKPNLPMSPQSRTWFFGSPNPNFALPPRIWELRAPNPNFPSQTRF